MTGIGTQNGRGVSPMLDIRIARRSRSKSIQALAILLGESSGYAVLHGKQAFKGAQEALFGISA
ncbi:hypothetical protein TomTYG45_01900 [Sphingobium sp. TomTYG45]